MPCTESALSATWRMLAVISCTVEAVAFDASCSRLAPKLTRSMDSFICSIDVLAPDTEPASRSTSSLMPRIELLMCAKNEAVSSSASSISRPPSRARSRVCWLRSACSAASARASSSSLSRAAMRDCAAGSGAALAAATALARDSAKCASRKLPPANAAETASPGSPSENVATSASSAAAAQPSAGTAGGSVLAGALRGVNSSCMRPSLTPENRRGPRNA